MSSELVCNLEKNQEVLKNIEVSDLILPSTEIIIGNSIELARIKWGDLDRKHNMKNNRKHCVINIPENIHINNADEKSRDDDENFSHSQKLKKIIQLVPKFQHVKETILNANLHSMKHKRSNDSDRSNATILKRSKNYISLCSTEMNPVSSS